MEHDAGRLQKLHAAREKFQGRNSIACRICDSCCRFVNSTTAVTDLPESMTGLHFHACLEIKCHRIRAPLNPAPGIQSTLRDKLYNKVQDGKENTIEQRVPFTIKGKILLREEKVCS